jgi:hypothetical protein
MAGQSSFWCKWLMGIQIRGTFRTKWSPKPLRIASVEWLLRMEQSSPSICRAIYSDSVRVWFDASISVLLNRLFHESTSACFRGASF